MKAIIIVLIILAVTISSFVNYNEVQLVTNSIGYNQIPKFKTNTENDLASLYQFRNTRIKKALAFKITKNSAKLA